MNRHACVISHSSFGVVGQLDNALFSSENTLTCVLVCGTHLCWCGVVIFLDK